VPPHLSWNLLYWTHHSASLQDVGWLPVCLTSSAETWLEFLLFVLELKASHVKQNHEHNKCLNCGHF
jgi:hypothetical protein